MLPHRLLLGREEGVKIAFLQLERDSDVAVSVNEKAGFVPAYCSHVLTLLIILARPSHWYWHCLK
jgi:hypothetical protein